MASCNINEPENIDETEQPSDQISLSDQKEDNLDVTCTKIERDEDEKRILEIVNEDVEDVALDKENIPVVVILNLSILIYNFKVFFSLQNEKDFDEASYPDTLNPFDDDREDIQSSSKESKIDLEGSNPFGSDDSDEEVNLPVALPRTSHLSPRGTPLIGPPKPPRVSMNPFGSDFEDDEDEKESQNISKIEKSVNSPGSPCPSSSGGSSARKKRPAPQPPKLGAEVPVPSPRISLSQGVEMRRSGPAPPRPPLPNGVQPKEQKERENLNRRSQQMVKNERNDLHQQDKLNAPDVVTL